MFLTGYESEVDFCAPNHNLLWSALAHVPRPTFDPGRLWRGDGGVLERRLGFGLRLVSAPVRRPEHAAEWLDAGVKMITFVDGSMLGKGCAAFLDGVRRPARKATE